jgi:drug/metabolite transporter (DMT)-like permease
VTLPASAVALALGAAVLHAAWTLLLARAQDSEAATAMALLAAVVLFAPVAALTWDVDSAAIPYIALSAAFELGFVVTLALALRGGHVGLVYPVSRGVAPVLVLVVSVGALGASISAAQAAGVAVIAAGVVLVRGVSGSAGSRETLLALACGACIAGYTLTDQRGLRHADPLPYLECVLGLTLVLYAPIVLRLRGRAALRAERSLRTLLAGGFMFGAYVLVLAALRLAPAAPVAALRETSVVFATVFAYLVLREPMTHGRLLGAAAVAAGVAVLALSP